MLCQRSSWLTGCWPLTDACVFRPPLAGGGTHKNSILLFVDIIFIATLHCIRTAAGISDRRNVGSDGKVRNSCIMEIHNLNQEGAMSDKKHMHALSEVFAHPIYHNLEWVELLPALASIGVVHREKNGTYHLNRNGHTVVFECSNRSSLDVDEIMKLRHFLRISAQPGPDLTNDVIVAISHHQALIVRGPGTPAESKIVEHANLAKGRLLHTKPTAPPYSNVGPKIDEGYYDVVMQDISDAGRIVILSHGTGSSNAANQLVARIREHYPDLMAKVAAVQRCDLEAMTEQQVISQGEALLGLGRPEAS